MAGLKSEYGDMELDDYGTVSNNPTPTISKEVVNPTPNVADKAISVEESTFAETQSNVETNK